MNNEEPDILKRAILYYPSIGIPSGTWLRKAILYWDEIASIVPESYELRTVDPYSMDIDFLKKEGVYKPVRPGDLAYHSFQAVNDFGNELSDIVLSNVYQEFLKRRQSVSIFQNKKANSRSKPRLINKEKGTDEIFGFLIDAGLANECQQDSDWYEVEGNTALLYMALLAKYLANYAKQATTPSTDMPEYQRLCFQPKNSESAIPALNLSFINLLPVPRDNISLDDILRFKRLRRDHLLQFRQIQEEFQDRISDCESQSEANEMMSRFGNRLERELYDLQAILKDSSISTVAGSFDVLIRIPPMAWLASLGVAYGVAKNITEIPIKVVLSGVGVAGAISLSKYLLDKRNEKRAALRRSPLSYLFLAKRDGILRSITRSIKGT